MSTKGMTGEDWEKLAKMLAGLLLFPITLVAYAFVVATFWGWFVVPLGAPDIGLAHAYGLAILVGMVAKRHTKDERSVLEAFAGALMYCGLALLFGWIAHLLM